MLHSTKDRNKGTFGGSPVAKTRTRVHADVPRYQKPERRYIRQNRPFTKPPFCALSIFCLEIGNIRAESVLQEKSLNIM